MFFHNRIEEEKTTVSKMIKLHCLKKHGSRVLCTSCIEIHQYAMQRLDKCRYGNNKPTCTKCSVHCYKLDKREEIRIIMRFSGPLMMLHHPLYALMHIYRGIFSNLSG